MIKENQPFVLNEEVAQRTKKSKYYRPVTYSVKLIVTVSSIAYIVFSLQKEELTLRNALLSFEREHWILLITAALLLPLNLGLEALKWRQVLLSFYPALSFSKALQAVLAGISTGIFTPNRVGEYVGRILYLEAGHRVEAILLTFVNRVYHMVVALCLATFSLWYALKYYRRELSQMIQLPTSDIPYLGILLIIFCIALFLALLFLRELRHRILPSTIQNKWMLKLAVATRYLDTPTLLKLFGWSILRYLTFSLQYLILLWAFGYTGGYMQALIMIWLVFLIKSLIPFMSLAEIGLRESVALFVMGIFGLNAWTIVSATFVLYLINIIFPAFIGLWYVYKISP